MKNIKIPVLILLIVLVVLNIYTLNKVGRLQQDIGNIRYSVNNTESTIHTIPSTISNYFNELRNEERWMTPVDFEATSPSKYKMVIKASWQIKDFKKGSKVVFNYKLEDESHAVEAIDEGNGSFYVNVEMFPKAEPIWINIIDMPNTEVGETVIQEEKEKERMFNENYEDNHFEFFVSVESEDTIKTSDKGIYSLRDLQNKIYGSLESRVYIDNRGQATSKPEITLTHNRRGQLTSEIQDVVLKVYNNEKKVSMDTLERLDASDYQNQIRYHIDYTEEIEPFDKLIMEVTYKDGTKFSREVYSKEE